MVLCLFSCDNRDAFSMERVELIYYTNSKLLKAQLRYWLSPEEAHFIDPDPISVLSETKPMQNEYHSILQVRLEIMIILSSKEQQVLITYKFIKISLIIFDSLQIIQFCLTFSSWQ